MTRQTQPFVPGPTRQADAYPLSRALVPARMADAESMSMDVTRIAIAQTPVQVALARQVLDQSEAQGVAIVRMLDASGQAGDSPQDTSGKGQYVDARA